MKSNKDKEIEKMIDYSKIQIYGECLELIKIMEVKDKKEGYQLDTTAFLKEEIRQRIERLKQKLKEKKI